MKIACAIAAVGVLLLIANFVVFRKRLRRVEESPIAISPPRPAETQAAIAVVVLSRTSCTLAGVEIESASLKERLVAAKAKGESSVNVKAAPGVSYEALIPILDAVRQAGIDQVSVDFGQR